MAKQTISQIANLAIIAKKRLKDQQQPQTPNPNKECFNCKKKRYYAQNCYLTSKKKLKNKKTIKKAKQT